METRTYTVYNFEELPRKSQEKALERWREHNDLPFLAEILDDKLATLLEKNHIHYITEPKVFYSLSCSQGDGAMFEGNFTWDKFPAFNFKVIHSGHYYHYNSKSITIEDDDGNDAPEEIYNAFNDVYVAICKKLERAGYDYADEEDKEENIKETFKVNEYMFTLDGKIA